MDLEDLPSLGFGLEVPELEDPESEEEEDESDDELCTVPATKEYKINDQTIFFPGILTPNQSTLLTDCLAYLADQKNILVECPVDEDRQLATITALLHQLNFRPTIPLTAQRVPSPQTSSNVNRVYYVSKSFEDTESVLEQLKKFKNTGYLRNVKIAVLGTPSQLCAFCDRNDVHLCSKPVLPAEDYSFVEADGKVRSVYHFKEKCRTRNFCAYRYSVEMLLPSANFVICPQQQFLSSVFRTRHTLSLENSFVIFDDGGNIENACYEEASASITTRGLKISAVCIESLGSFFQNRNQRNLSQPLTNLSHSLKSFAIAVDVQSSEGRESHSNSQRLLNNLKSSGLMGNQTRRYAEVLRQVMRLFNHDDEDFRSAMIESMAGIDAGILVSVQKLLASLIYMDTSLARGNMQDFSMQISTYVPPRAPSANTFKICFVNLAAILEPMLSRTASVIVSSSCLPALGPCSPNSGVPPRGIFRHEVESPALQFHENVIATQCATACFFGYCSQGPSQITFQLNYQNQGRTTVQEEIGQGILEIARKIPAGIVVFFPSVQKLREDRDCWNCPGRNGNSIMDDLEAVKHVFCELDFMNAIDAQQNLQHFRHLCVNPTGSKRTGAILLALHREKVSQVMEFQPGEVFGMISVGIPYHSNQALPIATKRLYIEHRDGNEGNRRYNLSWYNSEAFYNLNPKIAHFVRNNQTWFVALIFDERMEKKMGTRETQYLLPQWMLHGSCQWRGYYNFRQDLLSGLGNFIDKNSRG